MYVRIVRPHPTMLAASLVICTLLAASGLFAASARSSPTELLVHFVLPGGRHGVRDGRSLISWIGNVTCAIHRNRFRCSGPCDLEKNCLAPLVCRRDPHCGTGGESTRPSDRAPTRVLRSGQALTVGYFRCTARAAGLTCVSRHSRHGFYLSTNNESQRLF